MQGLLYMANRGRPPKKECLTDLIRRSLAAPGPDGTPRKSLLAKKITDLALEGKQWAAEMCMERMDGKVATILEHSGPDGGAIPLQIEPADAKRLVDAVERLSGDESVS